MAAVMGALMEMEEVTGVTVSMAVMAVQRAAAMVMAVAMVVAAAAVEARMAEAVGTARHRRTSRHPACNSRTRSNPMHHTSTPSHTPPERHRNSCPSPHTHGMGRNTRLRTWRLMATPPLRHTPRKARRAPAGRRADQHAPPAGCCSPTHPTCTCSAARRAVAPAPGLPRHRGLRLGAVALRSRRNQSPRHPMHPHLSQTSLNQR